MLMGSLYGLVFSASFLDSLKAIRVLDKSENNPIYRWFFSRPYWRLTTEKECFAKLPGFVEREIDEDMGVVPTYEGDGVVTKTNVKSLLSGFMALAAIGGHMKKMQGMAEGRKQELLGRFARVEGMDLAGRSADELHGIWVGFVKSDYFESEYTYFGYIFCSMILSTLFKDKAKQHVPSNEIMHIMAGLSDLSHMRPIYEMWDMGRRQYSDAEFEAFVERYRHHSQHELDISYPNWDEMPDAIRSMIADFGRLGDECDPKALGEGQKRKYLDMLARLPEKLHKDVDKLRFFLWWREEFRDVSTRSYYIIRRLSLALGRAWEAEGALDAAEDIFFLSVGDIEGKADLRRKVARNKKYFRSFANFKNPNELGNRHVMRRERIDGAQILKGVPCSGETVTAVARVIKDIHDAGRLEKGDILVTQCTDPAWTAAFSKLSGVITETGGMLSHAAVVSREYGLACILLVKNATLAIGDGDVITMDCKTGEIYKAAR
jgi:pyruvate,water dikinase